MRLAGSRPARPLITYGPGDALGEGILLGDAEHSTSAVARTPVVTLTAFSDKLRAVLDGDPALKAHIYSNVIARLVERLNRLAPRATPDSLQLVPGNTRSEQHLLGTKDVPADAYFGIQTARALENFKITGVPMSLYPDLIAALAMVKVAAAQANRDCGVIGADVCEAIVAASDEIMQGKLLEQFAVDVIQGGAGTSSNMNANEVIANRALELMGHDKGAYEHCRPNDDVNASQSTNDTYPTALKLAIMTSNQRLVAELKKLVEATQDTQGFVLYSATLKSLAVKMIKICNDLRLLASGPRADFAEIKLPEKQPGSSIMPGKVNPVIPEVMNQIYFKIIGNDLTVSLAAQAGQLQLNVMEPVIAASLLESIRMMMNGANTLRVNCIEGIAAVPDGCQRYVDNSIGVVTALVPLLGYKPSTELGAEALHSATRLT